MSDNLDVALEDSALLEEVELVSTLMIAATEHDEHLDQGEIDGLLGVSESSMPEDRSSGTT